MALSSIQWTDYTFNPWIGCRKVAPECANCYAETLDRNRYSKTLAPGTKANPVSHWGSGPRHRTKTWGEPLKWNRALPFKVCRVCGKEWGQVSSWMDEWCTCSGAIVERRARVFCASLADWLDDENVPIEWFADLLDLMRRTANLDWLMLTKRPENWAGRIEGVLQLIESHPDWGHASKEWPRHDLRNWLADWFVLRKAPANVWIGVSAGADQAAALEIPARVHFLSCEPMLRPLEITHAYKFDWIIFGGESGSKARPCDMDWIRMGVSHCRAHGIAPFVKQMGSHCRWPGVAERFKFKDSHGGDMEEWPADLRVREFPEVPSV